MVVAPNKANRKFDRLRVDIAAVILSLAVAAVSAPATPVQAAAPEVQIISATTFSVVPSENRIHVQVDATLTSHIGDTATVTYYVDEAFLGLLPGATNIAASSGDKPLSTSVTEATDDYTAIGIRLSVDVYSGQSYQFRVAYDLPGFADAAAPYTRVDESFISFPAWAHGTPDTPGSSIRAVLPAGFELGFTVGDIPERDRTPSGETVLDFGVVATADSFFALITASRLSALNKTEIHTDVGGRDVRIVLRGWADDVFWAQRVGPIFEEGLPVLSDLIGTPYPGPETLYVDETVSWLTGGYSGLYNSATGTVLVTEVADDFVTLHEAAHTWLNDAMVTTRWIGEGFADWYALEGANMLGIDVAEHAPVRPEDVRFALDAWSPIGDADEAEEAYGYAAAQFAAGLIAERAETEGLQLVWLAIDNNETAYQPLNAAWPERAGVGPVDSRRLLDLLEERTGEDYGDIWLEWVTVDGDQGGMAQRDAAREAYAGLGGRAGAWELPVDLRRSMDGWDFATARQEMDAAGKVLDDRDAIEAEADPLDVRSPGDLQAAFETGEWEVAEEWAEEELTTLHALANADWAVDPEPDVVQSVGLIGEELAVDLATALAAYEAGALDDATEMARDIITTRDTATRTGRQRLAVFGGGIALLLAGSASAWYTRRQLRSGPARPSLQAPADPPADPPAASTIPARRARRPKPDSGKPDSGESRRRSTPPKEKDRPQAIPSLPTAARARSIKSKPKVGTSVAVTLKLKQTRERTRPEPGKQPHPPTGRAQRPKPPGIAPRRAKPSPR